jgi:hypothetical protein
MKEIFSEWGSIYADKRCAGYFQVWQHHNESSKEFISASEQNFVMATSLLRIHGIPLILKRNTYSSQMGIIPGAYNAVAYLLNDSYVLLNELESQEETKERTGLNIIADLPLKTLAITSSNVLSLINTAKLLQLPLDETLKKIEIERIKK